VQAGPASPISPEIDSYFYSLQHGQCADLLVRLRRATDPAGVLFLSLADLCLGARSTSYQPNWSAAQIAYDGSEGLTDCLSIAARDGMRRALANHDATGLGRPDFRPPTTGTACEPEPTYVSLIEDPSGGEPGLLVLGMRLFEAGAMRIDGVWHEATSSNAIGGTECARVDVIGLVAPPAGASISVRVRGNGYRTSTRQWTVGEVLTDDDVANLDADACVPQAVTP
jgi:hypothetical protein